MTAQSFTFVKTGVVAELDGKFYGIQYEDGRTTEYGFGPIENAIIGDPRYCRKPSDMTYQGSYQMERLSKAKLKAVEKKTIFEMSP